MFQIMQVLSAQLIAITAYYAFQPASRAASIALAFITGFSSETALLHIRALTAKLAPQADTPAQLIVSPTSVDFGKVAKGVKSGANTISVTNRGTKQVSVISCSAGGDFACSTPALATVLGGGHSQVEVFFTPSSTGIRKGNLTIVSDAPGNPHVVPLSGEGT